MKKEIYDQELSADDLAELDKEIRKEELKERITDANIRIKRESGYFEAVSLHAAIDRWRQANAEAYANQRRKVREREAAKQGRTLRAYEPSTPERRKEQLRISKAKARQDPDYAAAEREANTAAKRTKRAAMTQAERDEANRIRREKRAAKRVASSADD